MQRIFVSLLVAACLLCTATALVESPDPTSGAVFVSQHVSAPSLIEAPGGPSHNTRNGLFHPGGRRVDHTSADDDDEEEEDDSQQKVSHDPSQNGDEGDDENAEESGEEEAAQEDQGSDAEDLNAERRAERLADRYGGIPEDYLGKDVDKIIQTRRDARQQSLIDAPKGHLSLFPPREMDEESDEDAPAPAPALASNVRAAPHGGRAGLGPRMQQVNSPSTFPETPAVSMSGNFVPGAGAMSMAEGIDPSYDVTSPADQAMYAFEQQQKLMMSGMPSIPMEGGGIMEQNIPLPRFGGVQQPQMPEFGGAPQMEQEPMMDRPKPEVKFVDPRFASARGPAPQRMPTRGFAQRGPADQEEEMQEEAPQRGAEPANEFRFRATSGSGASKASSKKWDHSQSHITQRFLSNIGYARQQRAMQRRRENGRDHPHDAAAPEAEAKQEQEQETQLQNLGVPPPPDFRAPSLMEEEARVHSHTAQGHTHRAAQRVTSEAESEAVPARRTRYERMFARPAPRARRGSLLEVDAASEAMDSMESREVQGKPAGLPDEPEFEAPPPDPSAAQASAPTGLAGLREEVYSPPHVVV